MKYTSTRCGDVITTFEEAICSGYAPDGGLFVPATVPVFGTEDLEKWATLGYVDLAYEVLRRFISEEEVSNASLREICDAAFRGFENPAQAVPVIPLGSIFLSELFHGPTFCFKDLGMRVTIGLLSYFATKNNKSITLLVSTTGDTGPAAVQAVADVANPLLTILVHYPEGQISALQRRQMTCIGSNVVQVVAFQGGGDDMDKPIKNMLTKQVNSSSHYLTGVNSYNFARPMAQIVHHIWTYLRVIELTGKAIGDEIDIVLPTGAMGNISGGEIARQMGLPIRKFCAAVNVNDITHRAFQTGQFHKSDTMIKTLSDAINIQLPYNFERLLFYLSDGKHELVKEWMSSVDQTAKLDLDSNWLERLQAKFDSVRVTDDEMCEIMRKVADKLDYFADPHTCVALAGAAMMGYPIDGGELNPPVAVLATASPCKFEESVTTALGKAGWMSYKDENFPTRAEEIMSKTEISPIVFKALRGKSLAETQIDWEVQARELVSQFVKKTRGSHLAVAVPRTGHLPA